VPLSGALLDTHLRVPRRQTLTSVLWLQSGVLRSAVGVHDLHCARLRV